MEGTIGEIRMFAANFAPLDWQYCQGQIIAVSQNTALFSILGTQYGGNGTSTFNLPDFRGRAVVGTGQGPGLSNYNNGTQAGAENVTILSSQLPAHSHVPTITPGTGAAATIKLNAFNTAAGEISPAGNLIGNDTADGVAMFATSGTPVAMAPGAIAVSNVTGPQITGVTLAAAGGSTPHTNIQPSLGMNYIICFTGVYPSRD